MRTLHFISSQVWSPRSPSPESLALVSVRRKEWVIPSLDLQTVHTEHSVFTSKPGGSQCDLCPWLSKLERTQSLYGKQWATMVCACQLPLPLPRNPAHTAIPFILAVSAIVLPVATEDARNTAVGVGALELAGQADVNVWGREKERRELRAGRGLHVPCRGWVGCRPKPRNIGLRGSCFRLAHPLYEPQIAGEGMAGIQAAPYRNWPRHYCLGSHCPHHR